VKVKHATVIPRQSLLGERGMQLTPANILPIWVSPCRSDGWCKEQAVWNCWTSSPSRI